MNCSLNKPQSNSVSVEAAAGAMNNRYGRAPGRTVVRGRRDHDHAGIGGRRLPGDKIHAPGMRAIRCEVRCALSERPKRDAVQRRRRVIVAERRRDREGDMARERRAAVGGALHDHVPRLLLVVREEDGVVVDERHPLAVGPAALVRHAVAERPARRQVAAVVRRGRRDEAGERAEARVGVLVVALAVLEDPGREPAIAAAPALLTATQHRPGRDGSGSGSAACRGTAKYRSAAASTWPDHA